MTAEPRDELQPLCCHERNFARARLAAADRENAELRAAILRNVDTHADLSTQLAAAQAQLAEAQEAIDQSAEVMSSLGGALVDAEARLEAVRGYVASARATESTDHAAGWNLALTAVGNRLAALSAAPQPEPELDNTRAPRFVDANRDTVHESEPYEPVEAVKCSHGQAHPHVFGDLFNITPCPGPGSEPPASDEPARQSPEPDSRRWGGSMRPMPDPYRAVHNCVPEGCSECRPECRHCNGSGNAHTFDGDELGICGTCHGTGSAAGGGL